EENARFIDKHGARQQEGVGALVLAAQHQRADEAWIEPAPRIARRDSSLGEGGAKIDAKRPAHRGALFATLRAGVTIARVSTSRPRITPSRTTRTCAGASDDPLNSWIVASNATAAPTSPNKTSPRRRAARASACDAMSSASYSSVS